LSVPGDRRRSGLGQLTCRARHQTATCAFGSPLRTSHRAATSPSLARLRGELLLQSTIHSPRFTVDEEAEACFFQALNIAQSHEAKSLELRAATSLGRLFRRQGKRHEARDMLAAIYGWFKEGFGTHDLIEAKALLEEVS